MNTNNWHKGPIIGQGSTATVHLATTSSGDLLAVKSTHLSTSHLLQKEQQLLSKLNSPYIIQYHGFISDYHHVNHAPMYNLFMEYATGGTISDVIKNQGGCLDECLIRCYTRHILLGLDYLHHNNIVHCDVKSANVLVCKDRVKIGDLGCAKSVNQSSPMFSGTPVFMAPEVARGEEQGFESDIWSVACTVIEMATGSNPWPGVNNPVSTLHRIGYSDVVPDFPNSLSEEGKDFLKKCLVRNGKQRWTAKQLLQHPFVSSVCKCKKIESFERNSPNGVLDQGFWDSFDHAIGEPAAPTRFVEVSGESPVGRMEQLVNSCLPNWGDEGGWITVRSNEVSNAVVEDGGSESTRFDSDLELESESVSEWYGEEGFLGLDGIIEECNVVESSDAIVVTLSRFLDFKNVNKDGCVKLNLDLKFVVLVHLVVTRVLMIVLSDSIKPKIQDQLVNQCVRMIKERLENVR